MSSNAVQPMGPAGLKAVVTELYNAFGRGDLGFLIDLLADDIDWCFHGPEEVGFTGIYRGKEEIMHFFEQVAATHNVTLLEPREFFVEGDTIIVVGYEEATGPGGQGEISTHFAHFWYFEGSRIKRLRGFVDTAAFARVLLKR